MFDFFFNLFLFKNNNFIFNFFYQNNGDNILYYKGINSIFFDSIYSYNRSNFYFDKFFYLDFDFNGKDSFCNMLSEEYSLYSVGYLYSFVNSNTLWWVLIKNFDKDTFLFVLFKPVGFENSLIWETYAIPIVGRVNWPVYWDSYVEFKSEPLEGSIPKFPDMLVLENYILNIKYLILTDYCKPYNIYISLGKPISNFDKNSFLFISNFNKGFMFHEHGNWYKYLLYRQLEVKYGGFFRPLLGLFSEFNQDLQLLVYGVDPFTFELNWFTGLVLLGAWSKYLDFFLLGFSKFEFLFLKFISPNMYFFNSSGFNFGLCDWQYSFFFNKDLLDFLINFSVDWFVLGKSEYFSIILNNGLYFWSDFFYLTYYDSKLGLLRVLNSNENIYKISLGSNLKFLVYGSIFYFYNVNNFLVNFKGFIINSGSFDNSYKNEDYLYLNRLKLNDNFILNDAFNLKINNLLGYNNIKDNKSAISWKYKVMNTLNFFKWASLNNFFHLEYPSCLVFDTLLNIKLEEFGNNFLLDFCLPFFFRGLKNYIFSKKNTNPALVGTFYEISYIDINPKFGSNFATLSDPWSKYIFNKVNFNYDFYEIGFLLLGKKNLYSFFIISIVWWFFFFFLLFSLAKLIELEHDQYETFADSGVPFLESTFLFDFEEYPEEDISDFSLGGNDYSSFEKILTVQFEDGDAGDDLDELNVREVFDFKRVLDWEQYYNFNSIIECEWMRFVELESLYAYKDIEFDEDDDEVDRFWGYPISRSHLDWEELNFGFNNDQYLPPKEGELDSMFTLGFAPDGNVAEMIESNIDPNSYQDDLWAEYIPFDTQEIEYPEFGDQSINYGDLYTWTDVGFLSMDLDKFFFSHIDSLDLAYLYKGFMLEFHASEVLFDNKVELFFTNLFGGKNDKYQGFIPYLGIYDPLYRMLLKFTKPRVDTGPAGGYHMDSGKGHEGLLTKNQGGFRDVMSRGYMDIIPGTLHGIPTFAKSISGNIPGALYLDAYNLWISFDGHWISAIGSFYEKADICYYFLKLFGGYPKDSSFINNFLDSYFFRFRFGLGYLKRSLKLYYVYFYNFFFKFLIDKQLKNTKLGYGFIFNNYEIKKSLGFIKYLKFKDFLKKKGRNGIIYKQKKIKNIVQSFKTINNYIDWNGLGLPFLGVIFGLYFASTLKIGFVYHVKNYVVLDNAIANKSNKKGKRGDKYYPMPSDYIFKTLVSTSYDLNYGGRSIMNEFSYLFNSSLGFLYRDHMGTSKKNAIKNIYSKFLLDDFSYSNIHLNSVNSLYKCISEVVYLKKNLKKYDFFFKDYSHKRNFFFNQRYNYSGSSPAFNFDEKNSDLLNGNYELFVSSFHHDSFPLVRDKVYNGYSLFKDVVVFSPNLGSFPKDPSIPFILSSGLLGIEPGFTASYDHSEFSQYYGGKEEVSFLEEDFLKLSNDGNIDEEAFDSFSFKDLEKWKIEKIDPFLGSLIRTIYPYGSVGLAKHLLDEYEERQDWSVRSLGYQDEGDVPKIHWNFYYHIKLPPFFSTNLDTFEFSFHFLDDYGGDGDNVDLMLDFQGYGFFNELDINNWTVDDPSLLDLYSVFKGLKKEGDDLDLDELVYRESFNLFPLGNLIGEEGESRKVGLIDSLEMKYLLGESSLRTPEVISEVTSLYNVPHKNLPFPLSGGRYIGDDLSNFSIGDDELGSWGFGTDSFKWKFNKGNITGGGSYEFEGEYKEEFLELEGDDDGIKKKKKKKKKNMEYIDLGRFGQKGIEEPVIYDHIYNTKGGLWDVKFSGDGHLGNFFNSLLLSLRLKTGKGYFNITEHQKIDNYNKLFKQKDNSIGIGESFDFLKLVPHLDFLYRFFGNGHDFFKKSELNYNYWTSSILDNFLAEYPKDNLSYIPGRRSRFMDDEIFKMYIMGEKLENLIEMENGYENYEEGIEADNDYTDPISDDISHHDLGSYVGSFLFGNSGYYNTNFLKYSYLDPHPIYLVRNDTSVFMESIENLGDTTVIDSNVYSYSLNQNSDNIGLYYFLGNKEDFISEYYKIEKLKRFFIGIYGKYYKGDKFNFFEKKLFIIFKKLGINGNGNDIFSLTSSELNLIKFYLYTNRENFILVPFFWFENPESYKEGYTTYIGDGLKGYTKEIYYEFDVDHLGNKDLKNVGEGFLPIMLFWMEFIFGWVRDIKMFSVLLIHGTSHLFGVMDGEWVGHYSQSPRWPISLLTYFQRKFAVFFGFDQDYRIFLSWIHSISNSFLVGEKFIFLMGLFHFLYVLLLFLVDIFSMFKLLLYGFIIRDRWKRINKGYFDTENIFINMGNSKKIKKNYVSKIENRIKAEVETKNSYGLDKFFKIFFLKTSSGHFLKYFFFDYGKFYYKKYSNYLKKKDGKIFTSSSSNARLFDFENYIDKLSSGDIATPNSIDFILGRRSEGGLDSFMSLSGKGIGSRNYNNNYFLFASPDLLYDHSRFNRIILEFELKLEGLGNLIPLYSYYKLYFADDGLYGYGNGVVNERGVFFGIFFLIFFKFFSFNFFLYWFNFGKFNKFFDIFGMDLNNFDYSIYINIFYSYFYWKSGLISLEIEFLGFWKDFFTKRYFFSFLYKNYLIWKINYLIRLDLNNGELFSDFMVYINVNEKLFSCDNFLFFSETGGSKLVFDKIGNQNNSIKNLENINFNYGNLFFKFKIYCNNICFLDYNKLTYFGKLKFLYLFLNYLVIKIFFFKIFCFKNKTSYWSYWSSSNLKLSIKKFSKFFFLW